MQRLETQDALSPIAPTNPLRALVSLESFVHIFLTRQTHGVPMMIFVRTHNIEESRSDARRAARRLVMCRCYILSIVTPGKVQRF